MNSTGELLFGLILLYNFRQFEQQIGTLNFVKLIAASQAVSLASQLVLLTALPASAFGTSGVRLASGPYSAIFALLVQYFATIPKLHRVNVMGAEFSEKSLYYLVSAQLLFARGRESLAVGACGFISGLLCVGRIIPYEKLEFPSFLCSLATNYLHPILKSEPLVRVRPQNQQNRAAAAGANAGATGRGYQVDRLVGGGGGFPLEYAFGNAGPAAVAAPSEDTIEVLMGMGYGREQVVEALQLNGNDVNRAAEHLLGGVQ